jgi:hypothetical protein
VKLRFEVLRSAFLSFLNFFDFIIESLLQLKLEQVLFWLLHQPFLSHVFLFFCGFFVGAAVFVNCSFVDCGMESGF